MSGGEEPEVLTKEEKYRIVRSQLEHEIQMLNQRVLWFVFSQSFLFTAYATVLNAPEKPGLAVAARLQALLIWVFPVSALIVGFITYLGVMTSLLTMKDLRRSYESFQGAESRNREHFFPPIQGREGVRRLTTLSAVGMPLVFILTWGVVLLRQLKIA
jgi:hypothetical protein